MSAPALLYLHGFASSPQSSKARFFVERARAAGLPADCPDLNQPDFGTLTVTRMIERVRDAAAAMPAGPVALVGSSLGAFVALHAVAQPGWDPARQGPGGRGTVRDCSDYGDYGDDGDCGDYRDAMTRSARM